MKMCEWYLIKDAIMLRILTPLLTLSDFEEMLWKEGYTLEPYLKFH